MLRDGRRGFTGVGVNKPEGDSTEMEFRRNAMKLGGVAAGNRTVGPDEDENTGVGWSGERIYCVTGKIKREGWTARETQHPRQRKHGKQAGRTHNRRISPATWKAHTVTGGALICRRKR